MKMKVNYIYAKVKYAGRVSKGLLSVRRIKSFEGLKTADNPEKYHGIFHTSSFYRFPIQTIKKEFLRSKLMLEQHYLLTLAVKESKIPINNFRT